MFSFNNFYKPAPAQVQRIAAACKAVSGVLGTSALAAANKWMGVAALVLLILGESMEKLTAAPAPAAPPDPRTDPGMHPEDVTTPPAGPTT